MKFAHIRVSEYFTAKLFHLPAGQISLKKALAFASAFFWWGRTDSFAFSFPFGNENRGVATVEPVSSDSPPDCRIMDLRILPPFLPPQKTAILADSGFSWWGRTDSNHRSETQQIYSLSPLATRELPHMKFVRFCRNGAGRRTRTPDLLITNQLLYRLSYTGNSNRTHIL